MRLFRSGVLRRVATILWCLGVLGLLLIPVGQAKAGLAEDLLVGLNA